MTKKGKSVAQPSNSEFTDMPPLFSDTTCNNENGVSSWEAMYNVFEEEHPKELKKIAMTDKVVSSEPSYFEVACSFLHRIAVRQKIFLYTDMVMGHRLSQYCR